MPACWASSSASISGAPSKAGSTRIIERVFGEVDYYVNDRVNWPLMVPDDDISGTFLFYRALEDNGFSATSRRKHDRRQPG